MAIVYHYTAASYLPRIVEVGALVPTEVHIDPGERPAVWFTSRRSYEPTAYKRVRQDDGRVRAGGYADLFAFGGGAIRFAVSRDGLTPWVAWRRDSGVSSATAGALAREAKRLGSNPRDWYVSYEPIGLDTCAIECQRTPHGPWERLDQNGGR